MTAKEERDHLYNVIATRFNNMEVAAAKIAAAAGMSPSRIRYVVEDLVVEGRIDRVPTRSINARYMRYKYVVREQATDADC